MNVQNYILVSYSLIISILALRLLDLTDYYIQSVAYTILSLFLKFLTSLSYEVYSMRCVTKYNANIIKRIWLKNENWLNSPMTTNLEKKN